MALALTKDAPGREERKVRFVELRAKGYSLAKIAERLNVSKSTLTNWQAELSAKIAGLRAMELEALYEEFSLVKEGRIRLLGESLQRLQQEMANRDLEGLPTEKLLELQLKYYQALREEYTEPRFLSETDQEQLQAVEDKTNPKLDENRESILQQLQGVLVRYRAGLISESQARQEASILATALKAKDQEVLEDKLDRLTAVLDMRE